MQTLQIVTVPAGAAAHNFNAHQAQTAASGHQSNANEQPAPHWLRASLLWMANNSALDMHDSGRVRDVLRAGITFGEALQLQQQLISAIHESELVRMGQRRQQIAAIIRHTPEFWNNTWFGLDRAQSYVSTIMDEDTEYAQLEMATQRANAEIDLWFHVRHLVEEALANGDEMQSQMRKAVRNPKTTEADDAAAMKALAEKLLANQGAAADKWALKRTAQRVYEMLWDAEKPQQLLQMLVQSLGVGAVAQPAGV